MLTQTLLRPRLMSALAAGPRLAAAAAYSTATATGDLAPRKVLITGSLGQLGAVLASCFRGHFGAENVITSDIRRPAAGGGEVALAAANDGPFVFLDVRDRASVEKVVVENKVDTIIHLSALLSAIGEREPQRALDVNINGLHNILEIARVHNASVFCPSTIGAFGPSTPVDQTPDLTIMRPTTIYGISKVHMELLGEYYANRYGVDFRSVRYPGIISADEPGGGTTDYAIDIFHHALKTGTYNCFLHENTRLPMMYIDDCIEGTFKFITAPREKLTQSTYNMGAIDFTPAELTSSMQRHMPNLSVSYSPDFRQKIADSWPNSLDDSSARKDWGWDPKFDLDSMVDVMFKNLKK
ncbi:UDP-glucose 4-epimerase [Fonticula alba]|uniref:L-threonine 3-dehydrogenase, mitochondrial n=1 Tax=Fonticula alba TaxID=691883 RepID=A0A058Z2L7_FONAL|nr:UDP-glucose 4-epimerase [Fonticula alba]KCV68509.1 UDP-glucose 4-epimerase [Fonticula alba]|eukprot:XP_009496941.1 UDP-glucose 4-epimerase [Fonticula alba]